MVFLKEFFEKVGFKKYAANNLKGLKISLAKSKKITSLKKIEKKIWRGAKIHPSKVYNGKDLKKTESKNKIVHPILVGGKYAAINQRTFYRVGIFYR